MSVRIYKCRSKLQMTVGICKCRRGFTNASILFRKCLNFYSSPLSLNFDTNGTPYLWCITDKAVNTAMEGVHLKYSGFTPG